MRRLAWEQKYHAFRRRVKLAIGGEDDAYELSEQIEEAYQNDELSGAGYARPPAGVGADALRGP